MSAVRLDPLEAGMWKSRRAGTGKRRSAVPKRAKRRTPEMADLRPMSSTAFIAPVTCQRRRDQYSGRLLQ
jgi:hypothetical protein